MKKLYEHLQPYKFRMTVFALLCGATLLSLILFRVRTLLSGSMDYAFLIWNIFLAWIPLGLAYTASVFSWKRRFLLFSMPLMAILWMLFFPNAPYILTDLQHLGYPKPDVPLWFDMLLLIWFAWTGLLLGVVSMFLMHDIVRRQFGRLAGWVFVFSAGILSSLGIYIGRFLRWNSWDCSSAHLSVCMNSCIMRLIRACKPSYSSAFSRRSLFSFMSRFMRLVFYFKSRRRESHRK